MQISTDFFQTLNAAGIDLSSAFVWFDADAYDPSYRQVLDNPIGLETLQMEYLHFKVTYVNAIIRSNASADSLVIWAGEIRLIDDYPAGASGNYQPLNSTLSAISALSNSLGWLRNDSLGGLSWNQYPLNLTVGVNADTLPAITDNGSGSITVASTTCNLKSSTTGIQEIITYNITSATLTISADATYYLCISYNAGSPIYYIEGNKYNINDSTICAVYALWYVSGKIYYQPFGNNGKSLSNKINYSIANTQPYKISISGGLLISESSLAISATGAIVYAGTTPISLSAFASASASNSLIPVYHSSITWTYGSAVTAYDSTYYDPGTDRTTIPNSKYAVRWYYRAVDASNTAIYYVYGSNYYNTIDTANAETPRTDLPQFILEYCILIGKSIVQYGATSGLTYSIFNTQYSASLSGSYLPLSGGTLTGDLTSVNILPSANQGYDLGSSSFEWNNIYTFKLLPQAVTSSHALGSTTNYWWSIYAYNLHVRNNEIGGGIIWDSTILRTTAIANTLECDGTSLYFTNSSGTRSTLALSSSLSGTYLPLTAGSSYPLTGTLSSQSIIPTSNNTYNLGSSSLMWNNIYANYATIGNTGIGYWNYATSQFWVGYKGLNSSSAAYGLNGDSNGSIGLYAIDGYSVNIGTSNTYNTLVVKTGVVTSQANIVPSTTSTYNLGSSSYTWNNIYGNYVYAGNAAMATWAPSSAFAWFGYTGLNNNTNGNSGFLHQSNGNPFMCGITSVILQVASANKMSLDSSNINAYANIVPNSTSTYNLGSSSLAWNNTFSNCYYAKYAGIDTAYWSSGSNVYASFGHKACTSNNNFCLLQDSSGNSWLNGASKIEFQISNTAIAHLYSSGLYPVTSSTFNLGSSSYYWNTLYCNTINCNVINSASAITVTGGIISYTYDETGAFTPTDATGNIVRVAYAGLTTITLSSANLSSGKVIEIHLGTSSTAKITCVGIPAYIHYSLGNIVTVNAGATSSTIAARLILRIVRVGSQFDITVS